MAKILVIEDNSEVLEMFTTVIKYFGHEVLGTSETSEISTVIIETNPQLILLDVLLGNKVSGMEVCQTIKKLRPDIPIILMSADAKQLDDFESCQANDVLEKPFDIIELKNKIEKLLKIEPTQKILN